MCIKHTGASLKDTLRQNREFKDLFIIHQGLNHDKNYFVAEVTFKLSHTKREVHMVARVSFKLHPRQRRKKILEKHPWMLCFRVLSVNKFFDELVSLENKQSESFHDHRHSSTSQTSALSLTYVFLSPISFHMNSILYKPLWIKSQVSFQ